MLDVKIQKLEAFVYRIALVGSLELQSVEVFKNAIRNMYSEWKPSLILDLTELNYFDSSGLGAFLYLAEISDRIVMLGMSDAMKNFLASCYIRNWPVDLSFMDHEQDALALVSGGTSGKLFFLEPTEEQKNSTSFHYRKSKYFKFWNRSEEYFSSLENSARLGIPDDSQLGKPRFIEEYAMALNKHGRKDEALNAILTAIETSYASESAYQFAVPLLVESGSTETAIRILKDVLDKNPQVSWAKEMLGNI